MAPQSKLIRPLVHARRAGTAAVKATAKREGSIADAFNSLSGNTRKELPPRFRELKNQLVLGHEDRVIASWKRLLNDLRLENEKISRQGPQVIPEIEFSDLEGALPRLSNELRQRGVAVIKNVIPQAEARQFKADIEEYVRNNPSTNSKYLQHVTITHPQIWYLGG
jgi:hypothetical protein